MSSVGETLRRERLRKQLSLQQVSKETKIASRLLEAIETEQFDRLPGGVFVKSFVRQYAHVLGLDEDELAAEIDQMLHQGSEMRELSAEAPELSIRVPKLPPERGRHGSSAWPSLALAVAVILLCSGLYVLWQRSRRVLPAQAAHPVAPTTVSAAAPPSTPAPKPVATPQPAEGAQPPVEQTSAESNPEANLHVSLSADGETWVRAWADGEQVLTATLEPNIAKTVAAMDEIRVRTGNAGDLHMTVNGKPVGPIGPKGQIRIVTVKPTGVQIEAPPKPEPAPAPVPAAPAPEPL